MPEVKQMWGRFLHAGGIVFGLVLSAGFVWIGLTQAGVTGTHGTFTVEQCHLVSHHHTSKRGTGATTDYTCDGTFRRDDGKAADVEDQMSGLGKGYSKGHTFTAQRSGNDVMPRNSKGAAVKFIVAFGILLVDAFVIFWFVTRLDKNGLTIRQTWQAARGTAGRAVVIGVAAVAVVGLTASSVAALVLPG